MNKSRLANLILVVFSVGIVLLTAEFMLRTALFSNAKQFDFLREPSYYSIYIKDPNEDFFNEDYWKLEYLFNSVFNLENPHSLLGWIGSFDPVNFDHYNVKKSEDKIPVLLYGDSFAYCIDSVECFEDFLNGDTSFAKTHYLLNYGVGGYGIDQIYLLLKESLHKYENPTVIFSMLTTDLDRSMLYVRDAQKPYFELSEGELVLKGTPITLTSDQYFNTNPPEITSYFWNKAVNSTSNIFGQSESRRQEYIEEVKKLNAIILKKAFEELKSHNSKFLILLFKPVWRRDDWRLDFLKEICELNDMPYIVNDDLIKLDMKHSGKNVEAYCIAGDGHPNTLGNRVVSRALIRFVLNSAQQGEN